MDALNNTNYHTAKLFGLWVAPGFNDSDHYAAYLMQGGLQLPDREYYLSDSEQMRKIRDTISDARRGHAEAGGILRHGRPRGRIIELEHAIAQTHRSLADNEDIHKANNTWTQADFAAKAPGLDWAEYFRGSRPEPARQLHGLAAGGLHR